MMCEPLFSYTTGKASKPSGKNASWRKTMSPKKAEAASPRKAVAKTSSLDSHLEKPEGEHINVEKQISEPAVKMQLVCTQLVSNCGLSSGSILCVCVAELW